MRDQILELESLVGFGNQATDVMTINIRKNPYSEDGYRMAEQWYGANISWHWIEEFDPFPVSTLYLEYWEVKGAFSNPTLVLIDQGLAVVGVYNVYCIGRGVVDDVQTAESFMEDAAEILAGEWTLPMKGSSGEAAAGVVGRNGSGIPIIPRARDTLPAAFQSNLATLDLAAAQSWQAALSPARMRPSDRIALHGTIHAVR